MRYLKQNTATRVTVGPFLDKGDGITPETALTVTNCKLTLMVDDGGVPTLVLDAAATASGGNNDMVHVTNDDAGFYDLELTAAQTNYVGRAMLAITDAANHCPVFHEFTILPANVYDALTGANYLDVKDVHGSVLGDVEGNVEGSVLGDVYGNVRCKILGGGAVDITGVGAWANATQIGGQTVTASGGITFPAATLASTTNIAGGTITTATNLTNLPAAPTDWLTAAAVKADAVTKIQAGLSTLTQTQISGGAYDLTNATFIAALKSGLGTVPASGNWSTHSAADVVSGMSGAGYTSTRAAKLDYLDAAVSTAGGGLDAAGVRSAIGMATANLDTQLAGIATPEIDEAAIASAVAAALVAGGVIATEANVTKVLRVVQAMKGKG